MEIARRLEEHRGGRLEAGAGAKARMELQLGNDVAGSIA
jgi:hypothetical protein